MFGSLDLKGIVLYAVSGKGGFIRKTIKKPLTWTVSVNSNLICLDIRTLQRISLGLLDRFLCSLEAQRSHRFADEVAGLVLEVGCLLPEHTHGFQPQLVVGLLP